MKVFISSTYADLVDHRVKVAEAVERLGQHGVRMEVFGARSTEARVASLDEVELSEVFVGIYAYRYGHVPAGSPVSITRMEFEHARKLGKPTLCFVVDQEQPWLPRHIDPMPEATLLAEFKEHIGRSLVRDTFTTPLDLAFKVAASLGRHLLQQKVKSELVQASKGETAVADVVLDQVSRRAERISSMIKGTRVLLVNDVPSEMWHIIRLLRELGVEVVVATDSEQALKELSNSSFDAIISDMARNGVGDEGLRFLSAMRQLGVHRPTIFTVGQYEPERGTPAYAFGITNRVDDLLNYLFDVLERVR
jgi:CheY-like chemotaxis protein